MARVVSSSFVGATPLEADVDALTFRRVMRGVAGDLARIGDDLTGQNSPSTPITHVGGGQGALLGTPLWQQHIGRAIDYTNPASGKDATPGATWLCAQPVWIPDGETEVDVEVTASGRFEGLDAVVRCTTSAGVAIDVQPLRQQGDLAGRQVWSCRLTGLTRQLVLVFLEADTSTPGYVNPNIVLHSWRGFFRRIRPQRTATKNETGANCGVTTPGATEGVALVDFDDHRFADRRAIDGHMVAYLNRNLRGLEEFGSGWPAGGNASYTHVDHDGAGAADDSNPARSRFSAATRSLYANEPEVDFPLFSEAFGAFRLDGGSVVDSTLSSPPAAGMLGWFAPYPLTVSIQVLRRAFIRIPDFQSAASRLRWAILVGTDQAADITNWTGRIGGTVGPASSAFGAAFAAGPSSSVLALATGTGLAFTGDSAHSIQWGTQRSGGFDANRDELFLLGAALWFQP